MPRDLNDLQSLLAEFENGGLDLLTEAERQEFDRLTRRPSCQEFLAGLPSSVLKAMLDAMRRHDGRHGKPEGETYNLVELAERLPEPTRAHLLDAAEVGYWRGPVDPPEPWEVRLPAALKELPPDGRLDANGTDGAPDGVGSSRAVTAGAAARRSASPLP